MKNVDKRTFFLPAALTIFVTLIGATWPQKLEKAMNAALNWCTTYMGWLYVLGAFILVIFCIGICFSKYGKIRLGGADAKPELSFFKWFSIVLTSGMVAGICYWSVAEPVATYLNPPVFSGLEGATEQAAEMALRPLSAVWRKDERSDEGLDQRSLYVVYH